MAGDVQVARPKMPLWVKVFIGIGIAFGLLLIGVVLFGGAEHGPGRHLGGQGDSSSSGADTPPTEHSGTHAPAPNGQADGARPGIPTA